MAETALLVALSVMATLVGWILLGLWLWSRRAAPEGEGCVHCDARIAKDVPFCAFCGEPVPAAPAGPAVVDEFHHSVHATQPVRVKSPQEGPRLAHDRRVFAWATGVMLAGLSVRALAILGVTVLPIGLPDRLLAAVTVVAGIAAFAGFALLDSA